ncbi:hypothetical protein DSECCO2_33240 [anaerobic digester metagenome]
MEIKDGNGVSVKINGKYDVRNTSITYKTIDLIKKEFKLSEYLKDKEININHELQVPVGAGFGTSAGCALGASLGISKRLGLPLTFNNAAAIAHLAEIKMQSGLGDVIAEVCGGITLRVKEGAPGVGAVDKLILNGNGSGEDLFVISKTLGEIETSSIIGDPGYKAKINQTGRDLLSKLLENPDPQMFMKLSRKFSEETSLMDPEVLELVQVLEDETMGASMAMLGKTAFAISKSPDTSVEGAIVSKIDTCGCRFL